jgi:hypothetical protein
MCCALFRSSPNSGLRRAGVQSELPGGKKNSCGAPVASTATGGDDKAQKWKKQSGDLRAAMQASREVSRRCSQLYACNKSCCMIGGMLSLSGSPFVSAFACYIGHSVAKRLAAQVYCLCMKHRFRLLMCAAALLCKLCVQLVFVRLTCGNDSIVIPMWAVELRGVGAFFLPCHYTLSWHHDSLKGTHGGILHWR